MANWPDGHRYAAVLTHDVEGPSGIANIERVLEVEHRHGFVSSWNFVAEWYEIPVGTFERIEHAGCEIGLHGIKHDGKLFESRGRFEAELPKIPGYAEWWGSVGFRSPATERNADWMHELRCLYDSSFPDTDPFEPQPGGCCSILPFLFGDVVELPITLVQDHTLWEILRERSIDRWVEKGDWIARQRRADQPDHPPRLPRLRRPARALRQLPQLAAHPAGRLARAAARRRQVVERARGADARDRRVPSPRQGPHGTAARRPGGRRAVTARTPAPARC